MNLDRSIYDTADEQAEREADTRADASAAAGRVVSHDAVKRWLSSWGAAKRSPRPRIGD